MATNTSTQGHHKGARLHCATREISTQIDGETRQPDIGSRSISLTQHGETLVRTQQKSRTRLGKKIERGYR